MNNLLSKIKKISLALFLGYIFMPVFVLFSIPFLWLFNNEGTFREIALGGFVLIKDFLTFNAWQIFRHDIVVTFIFAIVFYITISLKLNDTSGSKSE